MSETDWFQHTVPSEPSDIVERLRHGVLCPVSGVSGDLAADMTAAADEIERLRRDCFEAYQAVGSAMLGDDAVTYTQKDVERLLDNLFAASNGEPRPHEDLLHWPASNSDG